LHWSSLTINARRGKGANAPTEKLQKEGNKTKTDVKIGFEMVAKVNKSKVGPEEGNEARLPFYYGSGFVKGENIIEEQE